MEKNIFLFVITAFLFGCSSKGHLEFNNVPIDGNPVEFAGELTKYGFVITDSTKQNEITLQGEFLSRDCRIHVFGTSTSNSTYKVFVALPEELPDSLQNTFLKIQQILTLKYGTGTSRYQKYKKRERLLFNEPGLKKEIRKGDFTKYTAETGTVTLEVNDGFISITYLDRMNSEIMRGERDKGE